LNGTIPVMMTVKGCRLA